MSVAADATNTPPDTLALTQQLGHISPQLERQLPFPQFDPPPQQTHCIAFPHRTELLWNILFFFFFTVA